MKIVIRHGTTTEMVVLMEENECISVGDLINFATENGVIQPPSEDPLVWVQRDPESLLPGMYWVKHLRELGMKGVMIDRERGLHYPGDPLPQHQKKFSMRA